MSTLPLFSYPSTIAWVDDDKLFLKAITRMLSNDYSLLTFNNPHESLDYFENYKPLLASMNFLRGCSDHESYDTINHLPVDLNVDVLSQLREQKQRYEEISVAVIDYNMPNMNGLELCCKLRSYPMKKILLTGEVDHPQAVAAFNDGLIDRFIRKDSPTLVEEIQFHLKALTHQYFSENSRGLLSHLEVDQFLPVSDPAFISFFEKWCKENNIKEHYLIDKHANFIVIDHDGSPSYFITHTDKTLSAFVELHQDDEEVKDLIQAVGKRERIPFFGVGKEAWQLEESKWTSHFYKPELFEGRVKYYWKVIREAI